MQLDKENKFILSYIFLRCKHITIKMNNITTSNSAMTATAANIHHTEEGTGASGAEGFKVGVRIATRASAVVESEVH
jgi:hypothetical protein